VCFVQMKDCRTPFQGGSFFDHEGQPYCETHYHAKRGTLCAGCHKPISGTLINFDLTFICNDEGTL
jgi:paxillin